MREWIDMVEHSDMDFSIYPDEVERAFYIHIEQFISKLTLLGYVEAMGRNRTVLISPDHRTVIKIPVNDDGVGDNIREANHFDRQKRGKEWIQIAACRVFYADRDLGIPMLMMRYVDPVPAGAKDLPQWVGFVDCQQVGYDHKGKLVAYDL